MPLKAFLGGWTTLFRFIPDWLRPVRLNTAMTGDLPQVNHMASVTSCTKSLKQPQLVVTDVNHLLQHDRQKIRSVTFQILPPIFKCFLWTFYDMNT